MDVKVIVEAIQKLKKVNSLLRGGSSALSETIEFHSRNTAYDEVLSIIQELKNQNNEDNTTNSKED
jgi:hypothetical protein